MMKKSSLIYDILHISKPWTTEMVSFNNDQLAMDFKIDYNSTSISCPICACDAKVAGKTPLTWQYHYFKHDINMTAYLPSIDSHNKDCKVEYDQSLLHNTMLLDIMAMQLKNTPSLNPLQFLFSANGLDKN